MILNLTRAQESLDTVAAAFGRTPSLECGGRAPHLAANKHRQLGVGFCGGLVALFSSDLPVMVKPRNVACNTPLRPIDSVRRHTVTSFYGSSCASIRKGALNTPETPFSHPVSSSPLSPTALPLSPANVTRKSVCLAVFHRVYASCSASLVFFDPVCCHGPLDRSVCPRPSRTRAP
eukprot:824533-Prorocentrum_minimum.AAC.1